MPNKQSQMKLFRDEENFLRHWMYDEVHYHEGRGTAKTLQVEHGIAPADLGILIAAAMPDPAQQEAAGFGPAPKTPHVALDRSIVRAASGRSSRGSPPASTASQSNHGPSVGIEC